jgi:predicted nucleic acid-binding protein
MRRFDDAALEHPSPPACGLECRDPDDQTFIDLAVAAGARWLVTRDRALLELAREAQCRHAIAVLTPAQFARAWRPPDETEPRP